MTYRVVSEWVSKLPQYERELPILYCCNRYWTPNEILNEVQANSYYGHMLQSMLESRQLVASDINEYDLAKQRLLKYLEMLQKQYPNSRVVALGVINKTYTIPELINEVQSNAPTGQSLIKAELERVKNILSMVGTA